MVGKAGLFSRWQRCRKSPIGIVTSRVDVGMSRGFVEKVVCGVWTGRCFVGLIFVSNG